MSDVFSKISDFCHLFELQQIKIGFELARVPKPRHSYALVPFRDNCPDLIWHSEACTGKSSIVKEDV